MVMEKGPPEQHDLRTHCHRLRPAGLCLDQPLLFRGFWVMGCQKGALAGSVCPSHQTFDVLRDPTGRPDLQPACNEMKIQRRWA